jgi:hypothetical protein
MGSVGLPPKPEEQELDLKRQELDALENQLVERELSLASLKGELASFEKLYLTVVGVKYAELDEIEAQIAELRARREPDNAPARARAFGARARAQESHANASGVAPNVRAEFSPSPSLKRLYRELARKIHPDLATNEPDRARRQNLMAQANEAYAEGDESRLRRILNDYESSPESVAGEGPAAELIRVIRKIAQVKRRLSDIADETKRVMESDLMALKTKVHEASREGRDVLNEMAAAVSLRINEAQAELKRMSESQNA